MNARLPLLAAAALSILSFAPARAADLTWTYTPTASATGAQTIDGITITPTYTWKESEFFGTSSGMLQIGKTKFNVVSVSYAFTAFPADIKSIAITGKTVAGNSTFTPVSATIGTDSFTGTASLTNTEGTITLTAPQGTQTGTLSILISNPKGDSENGSSQAIYLRSIVVTYKDPASVGLEPLNSPTGLQASNTDFTSFSLSWTAVSDATGYTVTVKNANNEVVGTPVVNGTGATVTGLASGGTYTAYVTALGDGTTHDDSEPASLSNIQTTAPTVLNTPTGLASSNVGYFGFSLSWTAVSDATSYTVTLSPAAGSVEVSGTAATVTGLAEGETYTASVVAKGNGTTTVDSPAATLDVTTATAPAVSAPVLTETDVSSSAFTVSWPAQNDATFSVRAWTLVPADVATEDFAGYPEVEPAGWTFNGTEANTTASATSHPVAFKSSCSMVSPVYPSDISSLSFDLQHGNATSSSFSAFGSNDGGETWIPLVEYSNAGTHISNGEKTVSVSTPGIRQIKFEYTKSSGNLYLGTFSVTGTGIGKQPSYLSGYGPDATAVAGTSVTISNPVAGETNYIEVTATGLSGKTAAATLPVAVPAVATPKPAVISVK